MTIYWANKGKHIEKHFHAFIQHLANRLNVGYFRYGSANRNQKYLTRMKKELKVYEETGNGEQLLNIANYCILEFKIPENPKFHCDFYAKSDTRKGNES